MTPIFMFLGGRKEGGEKKRIYLLVASELWHSTEKNLGPREKWWDEDYDSGIPTRLQLAQQNQPFLQATENTRFWKLVLGHRTAKGRRGQSNLLWLSQQGTGAA